MFPPVLISVVLILPLSSTTVNIHACYTREIDFEPLTSTAALVLVICCSFCKITERSAFSEIRQLVKKLLFLLQARKYCRWEYAFVLTFNFRKIVIIIIIWERSGTWCKSEMVQLHCTLLIVISKLLFFPNEGCKIFLRLHDSCVLYGESTTDSPSYIYWATSFLL